MYFYCPYSHFNSLDSLLFIQEVPTTPMSIAPTPPERTGSAMGVEAETRYEKVSSNNHISH